MNLKQSLKELGLSVREIEVYIALLELGKTTTGPLSKKSGVPLSKIYQTLDRLINKGLSSYILISKTKHFKASDPKNLVSFIEEKKQNLLDNIPELIKKQKSSEDIQEAEVYEGIKGITTALNNLLENLKKGEEYQVFALREELETEGLKNFFRNFHHRRNSKGVKVRLIVRKSLEKMFKKEHLYKGMIAKFVNLTLPTGIYIYKNHVITLVWGEVPSAYVITSKTNYERYKEFFEESWNR
ncbi:hypothetical protein COU61_05040 [Candidatus Pacearchaeota archaeon CG10_big_fil_rev_8_21_14_0_10_35_13]|nr:MAG: hypothetical protein COU61_05040 [Candidatus Pacearchaeota archaeon CG10_big_fil_rev_8_21_14_0_10_35_13]